MLLQIGKFPFPTTPFLKSNHDHNSSVSISPRFPFRCASELASGTVSVDDIAAVLHNKVLVAAAVSAAVGQVSKPFTSAVFYGKKFDLRAAARAGGFPSTHSSAAVATATSLGLERGFSDAIFGLAVVYACLIMYDAQGVRREVGIHAKELNKVIVSTRLNSSSRGKDAEDLIDSRSRDLSSNLDRVDPICLEEQSSLHASPKSPILLIKSDDRKQIKPPFINSSSSVLDDRPPENVAYSFSVLKESIGHTEIEVTAGALLGLLVSLAICPHL